MLNNKAYLMDNLEDLHNWNISDLDSSFEICQKERIKNESGTYWE